LSFGAAAVHALREGHDGIMVALNPPCINFVPLEEAVKTIKTVPPDGDLVIAARALNIGFGD
jgi:6-phosphofructokinase 1